MTQNKTITIECQGCRKSKQFESVKGENWNRVEVFKAEHNTCGGNISITNTKEKI